MGKRRRHKRKRVGVDGLHSGKKKQKGPRNEFAGSLDDLKEGIPRIKSMCTSKDFFERFIAKRIPVVIETHPDSKEWKIKNWKGNEGIEYMRQRGGQCKIKVEQISEEGEFGKGNPKKEMKFQEFLDTLMSKKKSKSFKYYLTTQAEEEDSPVIPPPASGLKGDFPIKPELLCALVPHRVNLWMGASANGSSSGLHHDFHDNLYVLIRGRKRFTLFSPSDATKMYTYGNPSHIHWNGLIDYSPGAELRSDGAHPAEVAKVMLKVTNEKLEALQDSKAPQSEIDKAENEIEKYMEKCLDFEMMDESIEDPEANMSSQKSNHPMSFSKVSIPSLRRFVSKNPSLQDVSKYPKMKEARSWTVTLNEGQMLYLPAGWFHEVTSFGSDKTTACVDEKLEASSSTSSVHMALNYWMYPPSSKNFETPYEDSYWEHVMKSREEH